MSRSLNLKEKMIRRGGAQEEHEGWREALTETIRYSSTNDPR
jgi:hypothetical protein